MLTTKGVTQGDPTPMSVYQPGGKAGKVKRPISTLDVFPKALPVCHLKKQTKKNNLMTAVLSFLRTPKSYIN